MMARVALIEKTLPNKPTNRETKEPADYHSERYRQIEELIDICRELNERPDEAKELIAVVAKLRAKLKRVKDAHANLKASRSGVDFSIIKNLNMEAWDLWLAYRQKTKRRRYSTDMKAKELATLPPDAQMKCVRFSADNEYAGLFPERFKLGGGKKSYYDELREGIDRLNQEPESC